MGKPLASEGIWEPKEVPTLRYKGVFDWTGLYQLCRKWIAGNNYKFQEKRYKHKGDEIEVDMNGDRKIDEMHKYLVDVGFHIWGMKEKTVMKNGKALQLQEGRIEIKLKGTVVIDYTSRFDEGKLAQRLGKWWITIRRQEINAIYHDQLTYDLYSLHADIKSFLEMTTDYNAF